MRGVVLGHQQHAAGEAVQPVHDSRPQRAAHAGERLEAVQQRVHQRAGMDARAGMHHHAGRLIDGHQVGVFVKDGERNVFGRGVQRRRFGRLTSMVSPPRTVSRGRDSAPFTRTRPSRIHS